MAENKEIKANSNYVIEELLADNAKLNHELAIYKAIIREQNEKYNSNASASGE